MITREQVEALETGLDNELVCPFIPRFIKRIDVFIFNKIVANYEKHTGNKYISCKNK